MQDEQHSGENSAWLFAVTSGELVQPSHAPPDLALLRGAATPATLDDGIRR